MKNSNQIKYHLTLVGLLLFAFTSCKKDTQNGVLVGSKGTPTITKIRTVGKSVVDSSRTTSVTTYDNAGVATTVVNANYNPVVSAFDSTTTSGKSGNYYAIIGTHLGSATNIVINGVQVLFNRAFASDNSLIFNLPSNVPYASPQPNTLQVVTLYGTVNYTFTVLQPAPQISSFSPVAGSTGDTVTITGTILDGATAVKFGQTAATAVSAKIVSNTPTQIKVLVPTGIVQAFIFVTTAGGTVKSTNSFGYKYLIYADALTTGWGGNGGGYSGYNSTITFNNTAQVARGTNSIKVDFKDAYGAMQIGYGGSTAVNVAALGLKSVKFFVYGGAGVKVGDKLQVVINGNYNGTTVTIAPGAYTSFTIPLSSLGNPATITEFTLQGQGTAVPSTIYVDDIGFI
ncbi:MAG: hypothetical protein EOP45_01815 [Sphingobacteriaceae bacterium]|nr:MAG: hypothetical protein EOP45_01815 [Sphingobacteriaceae bacterium]